MKIDKSRLTLSGLAKHKAQKFIDEVEKAHGSTNLNLQWLIKRVKKLLLPGNFIACETCGMANTFDGITIDHKIPRTAWKNYKGNIHEVDNLQLVCATCNSLKGQKTLPEFLQTLNMKNDEILTMRKSPSARKLFIAPLYPNIGLGLTLFGPDRSVKKLKNKKKKNKAPKIA